MSDFKFDPAKYEGHIEGPWGVVSPSESDTGEWEVEDGYGRTAVILGETNRLDVQANARLIADAPAIKDKLVKALEVIRHLSAPARNHRNYLLELARECRENGENRETIQEYKDEAEEISQALREAEAL